MPAVKLPFFLILTQEPLHRLILAQEPLHRLILAPELRRNLVPEPELQPKNLSTTTFQKKSSLRPILLRLPKSALVKLFLHTLSRKTRYKLTLAKRYLLTLLARYTRRLEGTKAMTVTCSVLDTLKLQGLKSEILLRKFPAPVLRWPKMSQFFSVFLVPSQ